MALHPIVGFAMFICKVFSLAMFQQVDSESPLGWYDLVGLFHYYTWYGSYPLMLISKVATHWCLYKELYSFFVGTDLSSTLWLGIIGN